MHTLADRETQANTGLVPPDRLRALAHALRCMASDARNASESHADGLNSSAAAALRGKKLGYLEAAHMVEHIINGKSLHPRRYSTERRLNQWWAAKRRCACYPRCDAKRHHTEDSPYMDDYCHDCTWTRCDVSGHAGSFELD